MRKILLLALIAFFTLPTEALSIIYKNAETSIGVKPSTLTHSGMFTANGDDVPFYIENGFVIVEAKIRGDLPVWVLLSTGSERSIVDNGLLEKYKLASNYAADGEVTGRNDRIYFFSPVTDVSIGSSKTKNLNMRFGSMGKVTQIANREIFGALGADFFAGQIVQFDFKKKVLRFFDKIPADLQKAKNSADRIVLKMAEPESNPFGPTILVPVVEKITFNGKQSRLLFDTGKATSLAISSATAKKIGLAVPPENSAPVAEKISSLYLGTYEMTNLPAEKYAKGTGGDQLLSKYGVIAGSEFLQNFVATFDFRNKVIILDHN